MIFEVGFASNIGRKRSNNQDSGASLPDVGLFIVADGMGGHQGGETASKMAVEEITAIVKKRREKATDTNYNDAKEILTDAIQGASRAIYLRSQDDPSLQGMGTTTTAIYFSGNTLNVGHVGDSRCYFIKNGTIWQITRDHSLVQEKLRAGMITRDQIKTDRMKNVITRSVGFDSPPQVDVYEYDSQPGDGFLLCSDGLSGLVDDRVIVKIINDAPSPQKAVDALIKQANDNGGDDNITALLVKVAGGAH